MVPKLEILEIFMMKNLKQIWPCQITCNKDVNVCILREIEVRECDSLVNLFPSNPMPLLHHLERLEVGYCDSIEVLFNINLGCVGEIEESSSSSLRHITASGLGKLREIWRINGVNNSDLLIHDFQTVEYIWIRKCKSFRNVFTPTTTNFDMSALTRIYINGSEDWGITPRGQVQRMDSSEDYCITAISGTRGQAQSNVISKEEISEVGDNVPNVVFPFHLMHTFHHLQELGMNNCKGVEVAFDMRSASSREPVTIQNNKQTLLLPNLKDLSLSYMERMSYVWKCKWNKFLIPQKQTEPPFHNLTNITLLNCNNIKYLFSPLMAKFLSNLKDVTIQLCDGIEEVVSNRDDEDEEIDTSTHIFPCLDTLSLHLLGNLKRIGGGGANGGSNELTYTNVTTTDTSIHDQFKCSQLNIASWSLCQYSRKIEIQGCDVLSSVIASHVVGQVQKLEELVISSCTSMMKLFEFEGVNNDGGHSTNDGDGRGDTSIAVTIPRSTDMTLLELPNLKILQIDSCDLLEHILTSSTFESLKQLKELTIKKCKAMQVIVKEDGEHTTTTKVMVLPRLKSLTLANLPNLKGFFLGMNEFHWPLLDMVNIYGCLETMIFTRGHFVAPKLKYIHTLFGKYSLESGLNFQASHEAQFHNSSTCPAPDITKFLQFPWSFSNLIEVNIPLYEDLSNSHVLFPFNELLKLQNLETVNIRSSALEVEELFEIVEGTNDDVNKTKSVVIFRKLKEVVVERLRNMTCIWKSNQWITLNFPNLRKLSIKSCFKLGHVFTSCMVGSLFHLQELEISDCTKMEVIVKQVKISETRVNEVVFPCLKSLILRSLRYLKGFYLGRETFLWPSLDTLEIKRCPQITVFTYGQSTSPELKVIDTTFGLCYVREDLTSFIKTKQQEGFEF